LGTISIENFTSENYKLAYLTLIMSPHYLVKRKSIQQLIVDHTQHIYWLLLKPPTYYWLIEHCRQDTVDKGDMDTYFDMRR